jgi:hypothetical protein
MIEVVAGRCIASKRIRVQDMFVLFQSCTSGRRRMTEISGQGPVFVCEVEAVKTVAPVAI